MDPENLSTDLAGLLGGFPKEADREVLVIDFQTDQGKGFGLFYGNTEEEKTKLIKRRWTRSSYGAPVTNINPVTVPEDKGMFFRAFSDEAASDDKVRIFADALIGFLNEHKEIKQLELRAYHASAFISYIAGQCQHLKQINCLSHYSDRERQDANDLLPSNAEEAGERKKRKAEEERREAEEKRREAEEERREAEEKERKWDEEWREAIPEPKGLEFCPKDCDVQIWKSLNSEVKLKRETGMPNKFSIQNGLSIFHKKIPGYTYRYTAYVFGDVRIDEQKITIVTKTCLKWCKVNNVKTLNWYVDLQYQPQQQQAFLKELEEDDNLETISVSGEVDEAFRKGIQAQLKENLAKRGKSSVAPVISTASPAQQPKKEEPKAQVSETRPLNSAGEKSSHESKGQNENLPVLNLLSCILLGANVAMLLEGDALVKGVAFLATTGLSSVVALKASEEVREQPIIKYGLPALLSLTLVAQAAHLAR